MLILRSLCNIGLKARRELMMRKKIEGKVSVLLRLSTSKKRLEVAISREVIKRKESKLCNTKYLKLNCKLYSKMSMRC